jgi:hypothetical protein
MLLANEMFKKKKKMKKKTQRGYSQIWLNGHHHFGYQKKILIFSNNKNNKCIT